MQDIPESENKDCNGNFDISASVENALVPNTSSTDEWEHYSVMESNSNGEHLSSLLIKLLAEKRDSCINSNRICKISQEKIGFNYSFSGHLFHFNILC